jgi:hypothetical protein
VHWSYHNFLSVPSSCHNFLSVPSSYHNFLCALIL